MTLLPYLLFIITFSKYIIHVVHVYMEENMCRNLFKKIDASICFEYNVDFQAKQMKVFIWPVPRPSATRPRFHSGCSTILQDKYFM